MKINAKKNSQQNTNQSNSTIYQKDHLLNQVGFFPGIQGWVNICKSIKVIHHINNLYGKQTLLPQ